MDLATLCDDACAPAGKSRVTDARPPWPSGAGTMTFLVADIGSVEPSVEGDQSSDQLVLRAIVEGIVDSSGGFRLLTARIPPSALVAGFVRASEAAIAAGDVQRAIGSAESALDAGLRVAIHTGESHPDAEAGDPLHQSPAAAFDATIVQTSRLCTAGSYGQVLISQTSADLVRDRLLPGVELVDLGRHRVKDLFGSERVSQLVFPGMRAEFPPLSSLDRFRSNVPVHATPLIGRLAELDELCGLIGQERVVTLTGSGGCGKSRLAGQVAIRVADRFPGGVAWVELAGCSDRESLVSALAIVLGTVELAGERLIDRVVGSLRTRGPVLIVLDNAEHILAATADVVASVADVAHVTVLSTSREPIGAPGELVWRVPSLSTPPGDLTPTAAGLGPNDFATLESFEAVQLFVDRARRARRGFVMTPKNAAAVVKITRRLDGVPLAIELAAARVRTLPPEQIAAQLDDRFRLLTGGPRTLVARQQTLQASVAWSEGLLLDEERAVFRRLGVFVGGFTADAVESVVAAFGDIATYDVAEILSRLVDKSLVQIDDERDRYTLLETIRSYAMQRLIETEEIVQARDAHAAWCAWWLESIPTGDDAVDANAWWENRVTVIDQVSPEWPNCAAALDWVDPRSTVALRIVAGLGDYWALCQGASDSKKYGMPAVLTADRERPEWLTAVLRLQAVRTNAMDLEFGQLRDDAVRIATAAGDRRAVLRLELTRLITLTMLLGPSDELVAGIRAVRADAEDIHDWFTAWNAMQSPAVIFVAAGRIVEGEQAVTGLTSARAELIRANIAQMRGELQRSAALARHAQRLVDGRSGATMDRMLIAFRAAGAALAADDPGLIELALHDADVSIDTLPGFFASTNAIVNGIHALLRGHLAEARQIFADVQIDLFTSWQCVGYLAQVALADGDVGSAREAAHRLLDTSSNVDAPFFESTSELVLAECSLADGDLTTALDGAHRALTVAAQAELWLSTVDALETIATVLVDLGRSREACRLLAATTAARTSMGYRYRFPHRARAVGVAVASVAGSEGWAEGAALSLSEAVTIAQRMRGERLRPIVGWESLTPTELQVVEQVSLGLTNARVAEKLLMSRATVKTHLVHVYAKLGFSSRAELAAAVARRGTP